MKKGYGSPIAKRLLTQTTWRITGLLSLGCAAVLAWNGASAGPGNPLWWLVVYWGSFVLCLLIAMYCALLDLKYIRLQYFLQERQIFEETLGNPEFREAIVRAQRERRESPPGD